MKILNEIALFNEIYAKCSAVKNRLLIASPYIGSNNFVSHILGNKWHSNPKIKFSLLVDYSNKGNCVPKTLRFILDNGAKIKSLRALHAKIYIFDDEVVLTSANLTETAFKRRYEIGVSLNESESKVFIDYYYNLWKKGELINKNELMNDKAFRKRYGKPPDEKNNYFPVLFDIKIPKINELKNWLKISGISDFESRKEKLKLNESIKLGFIHTKKGRNGGGKPSLKKDEVVILSRMGINKNTNDHYIYGRAKVDIPYRELTDNQLRYIKYINENRKLSNEKKTGVIRSIERWPFGVWLKDMEYINGSNSEFVWISELKDKNGENLIKFKSLAQQSHIGLTNSQLNIINEALEKNFDKYGKLENKKPVKNWINDHIPNKKNWSTR